MKIKHALFFGTDRRCPRLHDSKQTLSDHSSDLLLCTRVLSRFRRPMLVDQNQLLLSYLGVFVFGGNTCLFISLLGKLETNILLLFMKTAVNLIPEHLCVQGQQSISTSAKFLLAFDNVLIMFTQTNNVNISVALPFGALQDSHWLHVALAS